MTSFSHKDSTNVKSGDLEPIFSSQQGTKSSGSTLANNNRSGNRFIDQVQSDSEYSSLLDNADDISLAQPSNIFALPKKYAYLSWTDRVRLAISTLTKSVVKYAKFVGPGIMVSVAYMDPGNYSTAVSAGALYQYKLLFVVLISTLFAVFLQTLCVKLGSVTGLDLAQNCREHLPRWLCIAIYILAEIAIIATDLAEVVGMAISLNILFHIPLPIGVSLTVVDVLLVLLAYRPNGELKIVRYFEYMVSLLVILVVICFAIELGNIDHADVSEIFKGFLPSSELLETRGLYLSCGILGATVMPHSLYLGSGLVQPRLRDYDKRHGYYNESESFKDDDYDAFKYKPSIHAINYAMTYSVVELVVSLFTVAIFVNSAILIVAGATLSGKPGAADADLFSIYNMLQQYLSPAAGTIFALALLFSGQSAGIVCTLSGQMVSEGFLHWSFKPWIRRLITRGLAIAPCLLVAVFVGRKGLADVLNASQVVLSLLLPFVSAPLLYFTCKKSIMRVPLSCPTVSDSITEVGNSEEFGNSNHRLSHSATSNYTNESDSILKPNEEISHADEAEILLDGSQQSKDSLAYKDMSNSQLTNILAFTIFAIVSYLNIFMIVSMAMGADIHF